MDPDFAPPAGTGKHAIRAASVAGAKSVSSPKGVLFAKKDHIVPPALAYEDGVRPDASTYRPTPKARFLPAPLIRARAEVFDPRNCLDLNRVARHALFGILAFFDVRRPAEPVFASRESICAESLLGS